MAVQNLTVEALRDKLNRGESLFILDVRNESDYDDWKIEGPTVHSINIPYFEFLDDEDVADERLPDETDIVTVCAKGGSSQYVAEILDGKGYNVYSLEGGMKAWSQVYNDTLVFEDDNMKLFQVNRMAKGCLSYLIVTGDEAAVVDPGRHTAFYIRLAEREGARIRHVMDTHLHADHISGGPGLAEETGATYYIASEEVQGAGYTFAPLEKEEHIHFGQVDIKVLALPTPGHTPGSTSFVVNDRFLLSGDTLFVSGLGRPDLGGKAREWAELLYDTVFHKLSDLQDQTLVLPAHYADMEEMDENGIVGASLGEIRENNRAMQTKGKEVFTELIAGAASTDTPPNFEKITAINRGKQTPDEEEATELEIGPNRCAVHHHG
ncbi:glyoxylase-like metal-dependent hydrolase (beta-lactamase superfamily II) [Melghirimyces profundicolus]|uniref:Glyoxylase-like metal-dependent hydrolase (Beta-lactamase superfamily II) n=1 Tax=Melghirimyces profundicolus TaxID=1242148 RepID=A0A2T6BGC7_9BACL|nr:MBL fold metallo-hydrolase [Melghirimyces profundicolus]PTX55114.1 glyoxylase-like metal-dependent hydrolase (beta-lactamase superfamily II) [Melghirimyces profundicolus]